MQFFQFLNQRYPPPRHNRRSLGLALLFGLFIFGFLYFFEPFDINTLDYSLGIFAGFGLISSFAFLLYQNVFPAVFPAWFAESRWQVKHQVLFYALILLSIATLNGLYINYIQSLNFSWGNYVYIIVRTGVLGIIPIFLLVLFDYNQKLKKNLEYAKAIGPGLSPTHKPSPEQVWNIQTDLKEESFPIEEGQFLFARAEGNYVGVFRQDTPPVLYRLTLNSLEKQLDTPVFFRCHRSYLVNLKKIRQVEGNAQGLKILLEASEEIVPVSRKYMPTFRERMRPHAL